MPYTKNLEKISDTDHEALVVESMLHNLKTIYSNKSSEEYKCHGDITKISEYASIESMLSYLSTIKGFPKQSITDLKQLFNVLHRPIWKKMVTEFMHEPSDKNVIFTTVFTTGYRTLVGELGRIYASTEATRLGIVYKPDKVSRKNDMGKFIRTFNNDLESKLDRYIRSISKATVHQEAANVILATIDQVVGAATGIIVRTFGVLDSVFGMAKELNPIALMNALLTRHYDKKVKKFNDAEKMYKATKEAYDDYMKLPASKRKEKIEHRYVKLIDKYNIKMQDLKAEIDHYDKRAHEEADDDVMTVKKRREQKKAERQKRNEERKAAKEKEKAEKKSKSSSGDKSTSTNTSSNDKTVGDDKKEKPNDALEAEDKDKDNESQSNPAGKKDNEDFDWDF